MIEKDYNNEFRFTLTQGDVKLCERVFDADVYNPFTRYTVDIRDVLQIIIKSLQKTLSKKSYETQFDDNLDLFQYNQKMINTYDVKQRYNMRYNPVSITQKIGDRVIKGVECKIGLYINDKTIVERVFYVNEFNPVCRWSFDIANNIELIVNSYIKEKLVKADIKNIWDDYDLINKLGFSINQIREFSVGERYSHLARLNK
jgi:hypothetical protein